MTKTILFLVGSLRQGSFNRTLANDISRRLVADGLTTSFAEIGDLPLMNQDTEFPAPAAVTRLREQVQAADALWLVSPEYNEMIPGGLKNALDWLSRPLTPGVFGAPDFLQDLPVALSGAGGRKGARVGLEHLRTLTAFMGLAPLDQMVGVQVPTAAFMGGDFVLDDQQADQVAAQVAAVEQVLAV